MNTDNGPTIKHLSADQSIRKAGLNIVNIRETPREDIDSPDFYKDIIMPVARRTVPLALDNFKPTKLVAAGLENKLVGKSKRSFGFKDDGTLNSSRRTKVKMTPGRRLS